MTPRDGRFPEPLTTTPWLVTPDHSRRSGRRTSTTLDDEAPSGPVLPDDTGAIAPGRRTTEP